MHTSFIKQNSSCCQKLLSAWQCDVTAHGTTSTDSAISCVLQQNVKVICRETAGQGVNVVLNYRTVEHFMSHNCNVRLTV